MQRANQRELQAVRGLEAHSLRSRLAVGQRRRLVLRSLLLAACGLLLAASGLLLSACGGGGGGGAPAAPPIPIDLGLRSATVPTQLPRTFRNPLGATATIEAIPGADSPFSIPAGDLPSSVPAFSDALLTVVFTPTGPGAHEGLVTMRWTGGGQILDEAYLFSATGEPVPWTFTAPDFGYVLEGQTAERTFTLANESSGSPVTITDADVPPDFTMIEPALPFTVAARDSVEVRLSFAPTVTASYDGTLLLGRRDPGGNVRVIVRAQGTRTGEEVIDLGTHVLTAGLTAPITVDVHPDAVSVQFEAVGGTTSQLGLYTLEGPGPKIYETAARAGPVRWYETIEAFAARIPSDDQSDTALVSGGGTYTVRFQQLAGTASSVDVRVVVERRPTGVTQDRVLDLNIYTVPVIGVPASAAPTDAGIQAMLTQMDAILGTIGVKIGDVDYYDVASTAYNDVTAVEVPSLLQETSNATEERLNVFLVRNLYSGQLLGISQAIGGTALRGTASSGVISVYAGLTANQAAAVLTHECAHFLGVWHTTESTGTFDRITDTLECPAFGTGGGCGTAGGGYLMHWQALGGTTMSTGQGRILKDSPLLRPDLAGSAKRGVPRVAWPLTVAERRGLAWNWCGHGVPAALPAGEDDD